MNKPIKFEIIKQDKTGALPLMRAGVLTTPHGKIETPAFVTVGTKATVKAMSPEQIKESGSQVVLANTYHLYLQPSDWRIAKAGGLGKFMNWQGPTMTDSGGFQVFSLGAGYGKNISKITSAQNSELLLNESSDLSTEPVMKMAQIDSDGVLFKSIIDGSTHYFTPERSIEVQHNIGADIIFAFDECTSPNESKHYQHEAMDRTHRWAKRSLTFHQASPNVEKQALFGIVQGARYEDLRKESAEILSKMDFDGYGIGGSFAKEDMSSAVKWVNEILPEEKPRHLLGIGEPEDLFMAVENGCDLFDCVAPTRIARNGQVYTEQGKVNLFNSEFQDDFSAIENCDCYTCQNYTKAYLSHLFRSKEMFAATLASIHNEFFIINLVKKMRQSILDGDFEGFKTTWLEKYSK